MPIGGSLTPVEEFTVQIEALVIKAQAPMCDRGRDRGASRILDALKEAAS
jgi:hypothetical protein